MRGLRVWWSDADAKNMRVNDRSMDRSIGVWSNSSIGSHHNLGVASTDGKVFITWQDARNGNSTTGSEDVYFSSVDLTGGAGVKADKKEANGVVVFGGGLLLGLGVAMALAAVFARKAGRSSA